MLTSLNYLEYRLAQRLCLTLPPAAALRWAERIADLHWRCSRAARSAVEANLSLVKGARLPQRSPLLREVFRNFGRYVVEFFTIHRVPQPVVSLEGYEHLTSALAQHRGTIALTAHLGNWEVAAVLVSRMGIPVTAVALPHEDPRMDRLFNQQRQRCGISVIPLGADATRRSLQRLRAGALLGLLGDWALSGHRMAARLCGGEVMLPVGPALLSLRSGAPIVPLFLLREGVWRFRLCVEPPIQPPHRHGASVESAVRVLTQAYAKSLERYLQRVPDQWLMFQPMQAVR